MQHSLRATCYAHSLVPRLGLHYYSSSSFSPYSSWVARARAACAAPTAILHTQRPISQLRLGLTRVPLADKLPRMSSPHGANMSTGATGPRFAPGSDESELARNVQALLASAADGGPPAANGGRWALVPNGEGLERSFKFKTFAKTWDFMTAVALQCKLKNHHPEWSNVYNTVFIRWTTHNPPGLSAQDIELAGLCDELARDFGEVVEEKSRSGDKGGSAADIDAAASLSRDDLGRRLADTAATSSGGQCCTVKTKPTPSPKSRP